MDLLISHYFNFDKIDLIKSPDFRLNESELLKFHFAVKELLRNKPIQYVLGETEFMGLSIKVDEQVLIPRPETEELVTLICKREHFEEIHPQILDIGCGSGCISISLSKYFKSAQVCGLDISIKALDLAKENANLNQAPVDFIHLNILDELKWIELKEYDMVISNPPYVRESEKALMHKNVLEFEPEIALFVPDSDPLLFYRKIAKFCGKHLVENGKLYFEINEAFAKAVRQLLLELNYKTIEIIKDIHGKDRFVRAIK